MFKRILNTIAYMAMMFFSFCLTAEAKSDVPEAEGIHAGSFVLHPGAKLNIGYDSAGGTGSSGGNGDGLIELGAFLKTRLDDNESYTWNNELSFLWRQFWGLGQANLIGAPNIKIMSNADIFKTGFVMISPRFSYNYRDEVEDDNLRQDFKNHNINVGSAFTLQPGGGSVFSQRLAYHLNAKIYPGDEKLLPGLKESSYLDHRLESLTRWNFLPLSSMSLLIDFRIIHFLSGASSVGDLVQNEGMSLPIRIKYSLQGLLLERLSYQAAIGYSYVYSSQGLKEHMSIAKVKLHYAFTEYLGLGIEYRKDHEKSSYGEYYKFHQTSLNFDGFWFDHLQTDASIGVGVFDFLGTGLDARRDILITADAGVFYHFWPGMSLGFEYLLRYNISPIESADYARHSAQLKFSYEY